jgi:hypothetical protein
MFLVVLLPAIVFSQEDTLLASKSYFEIKVEIMDVGSDYVGCGFIKYTQCFEAKILDDSRKGIFGEKVYIYITCPEVLNWLVATDNIYYVDVSIGEPLDNDDKIIYHCVKENDEQQFITKFTAGQIRTHSDNSKFSGTN